MLNENQQFALIDKLYLSIPILARVFIFGAETGLSFSKIKKLKAYQIDSQNKQLYINRKPHKLTNKAFAVIEQQLADTDYYPRKKIFDLAFCDADKYYSMIKQLTNNKNISPHIHRLCFLNNYPVEAMPNRYTVKINSKDSLC